MRSTDPAAPPPTFRSAIDRLASRKRQRGHATRLAVAARAAPRAGSPRRSGRDSASQAARGTKKQESAARLAEDRQGGGGPASKPSGRDALGGACRGEQGEGDEGGHHGVGHDEPVVEQRHRHRT